MKKRIFVVGLTTLFLFAQPLFVYANTDNMVVENEMNSKKNIPEQYRVYITKGSNLYHSITTISNVQAELGSVVSFNKVCGDGVTIETYYVYLGNNLYQLATQEGELLTLEDLYMHFTGADGKYYASSYEWEQELLELLNAERIKNGINPIEINDKLSDVATLKAQEQADLVYITHTSPVYGSTTQFAKHYGYNKTIGENLHGGFLNEPTPQDVFNAWMESEGHKQNMLNSKWRYMGIGWSVKELELSNGQYKEHYWFVQMFSQ